MITSALTVPNRSSSARRTLKCALRRLHCRAGMSVSDQGSRRLSPCLRAPPLAHTAWRFLKQRLCTGHSNEQWAFRRASPTSQCGVLSTGKHRNMRVQHWIMMQLGLWEKQLRVVEVVGGVARAGH